MHRLFASFLLLTCFFCFSQKTDSLWIVAKDLKNSDTVRLSAYYDLAWEYLYTNSDSALSIANQQLVLAKKAKNRKWEAKAFNAIGATYYVRLLYTKAIDSYQKAIKIFEEIGDKKNMAGAFGNIGSIYIDFNQNEKALDYELKCLKIVQEIGYLEGVASALNNIGVIYQNMNDFQKALLYNEQAVEMYKLTGDQYGLASAFANIGYLNFLDSNYTKAISFLSYALKISQKNGFENLIPRIKWQISKVYLKSNDLNMSLKYAIEARALAKEANDLQSLMDSELALVEIYKKMSKYKEAYLSYASYQIAKDSSDLQKKADDIARLEIQFAYDKKAAADSLKNAVEQSNKDTLIFAKNTQIENDRLQKIALYGGIFLMLISGGIMYNRFRFIRKQKDIIEIKNKETEEQKIIIEEKQKEILSSIAYAKRLQEAILPPKNEIKTHLPNSFIYYKPKDIVAGDFYWMERVDDKIMIAAADCTGHGVPGAMVSVVCSNALNRTVNEFNITKPGEVLDKARELVVETFERSETEVKDGMDISLCLIDKKNNKLQWAGANNPLWIIRKEEILQFKPDKQAIGKVDNPALYTTHEVSLEKDDCVYIFTDGYADQFGGPSGKKFKYHQLIALMRTLSTLPISEQQLKLETEFQNWKGNLEQVDDICIIGIKI